VADPHSDDLNGLKRAGIAFVLCPATIFCLELAFGSGFGSTVVLLLSIPLGAVGAAFLAVWAFKSVTLKRKNES
jgi:hypothetical protein